MAKKPYMVRTIADDVNYTGEVFTKELYAGDDYMQIEADRLNSFFGDDWRVRFYSERRDRSIYWFLTIQSTSDLED